jgi:uncharacterized protein with ATP-grasp and redox domains
LSAENKKQQQQQLRKADYLRYSAELTSEQEKKQRLITESKCCYQEAYDISHSNLSVFHPLHLALCVNFSFLHDKFLNNRKEAVLIAKKAYQDVTENVDQIPQEQWDQVTTYLKIFRENLRVWERDL